MEISGISLLSTFQIAGRQWTYSGQVLEVHVANEYTHGFYACINIYPGAMLLKSSSYLPWQTL